MSYDDPRYLVTHEIATGTLASAASATITKFTRFQKSVLKRVHAVVVTAGTDTAAGVDVYVGTSSVGELVFGTATGGATVKSAVLNASVPAMGVIELKGKASSDTLKFTAALELDVSLDAVETP